MTSINVITYRMPARTWRDRLVAFADLVHARGDAEAARLGWSVERVGLTGRRYHDTRLDQIGGAR